MANARIEPHKVTKPMQLMAVWLTGLVLVVGALVTGASIVRTPTWACALFSVAAVAIIPLFLLVVFLMQTKFRPQLQEDRYYAEWLQRQERIFRAFKSENDVGANEQGVGDIDNALMAQRPIEATDQLEKQRIARYQEQMGLFLVHAWRHSDTPGQVADIVIWLHQHGKGPKSQGIVREVEYCIGPKFFPEPVVKTNVTEDFRLEISAYGPLLCIAMAYIQGRDRPIQLERYIDFAHEDVFDGTIRCSDHQPVH